MTNTSTMTEKFAGKYSFESQDNFDAYVKDIGKNCNYFLFYARVSILVNYYPINNYDLSRCP